MNEAVTSQQANKQASKHVPAVIVYSYVRCHDHVWNRCCKE